jgi:hypothetical protein
MRDDKTASRNAIAQEEPRLVSEILSVATFVLKVWFGVGIPMVVIVIVLRKHPYIAMAIMYALMIVGLIVFFGHQSYRWKKKDLESKRRWKEQEERWRRQAGERTGSANKDQ